MKGKEKKKLKKGIFVHDGFDFDPKDTLTCIVSYPLYFVKIN